MFLLFSNVNTFSESEKIMKLSDSLSFISKIKTKAIDSVLKIEDRAFFIVMTLRTAENTTLSMFFSHRVLIF